MSQNKAEYSPSEALEHLEGVSKNALYNDMNNGVLSYTDKKWGKKTRRIIQGAELVRVYQNKFKIQNNIETSQENTIKRPDTLQENTKTSYENKILQQEIDLLKQQLESKSDLLEEVKKSRDDLSMKLDKAQETLQSQTFLLEHHQKSTQKPVEPPKRFLGIFPRKTT